jgi:acyl-homoserine lactone acylase PvdQ
MNPTMPPTISRKPAIRLALLEIRMDRPKRIVPIPSKEMESWIDAKGGIKQVALRAFQAAVDKISGMQGKDPSKWQWGKYHKVRFYNGVSSSLGPLGRLLNSKVVAMGGSGVTVGVASSYNGEIGFAAPWRTVIDMANPLQAYSVLRARAVKPILEPMVFGPGRRLDDREISRDKHES